MSLMVTPTMISYWEKLLMPAFVYFFKLLYPFSLANNPISKVAAAAGGCIFMKTEIFEKIDGYNSIKSELIDDCSLAYQVKLAGYRTWIGLTHSACSIRSYKKLWDICEMIARNAFTHESICAMRFCKVKYSPISFASGIFFILINILSSTIGLPVGVNLLGFHPKSCKYSPICLRDPRLNTCSFFLINGFILEGHAQLNPAYSSLVSPLLERVPSFLI